MGRYQVYTNGKYNEYQTKYNWEKKGYTLINEKQKGITLWTNYYCQRTAEYYSPGQIRTMTPDELREFKNRENQKRSCAYKKRKAIQLAEQSVENALKEREMKKQESIEKLNAAKSFLKSIISSIEIKEPVYDMVVVDVESTGLDCSMNELLQVSIIDGFGNILYDSYLKPVVAKWWSKNVNGITPDMVEDAPDIIDEIPKIASILKSAACIVGYNVWFDINFLKEYGCEINNDANIIDVMEEFAPLYGEWNEKYNCYKWKNLTTCASYFEYDWKETCAHNSLADCYATLFCYNKMKEIGGNHGQRIQK